MVEKDVLFYFGQGLNFLLVIVDGEVGEQV